jgi:hypothetical protein
MSELSLIIRDGQTLTITFTEEAIALREAALDKAAMIGRVSNAAENEIAVAVQAELNQVARLAEKSRVAEKAASIKYGRAVDAETRNFLEPLEGPELRIRNMVCEFQETEAAKAREAEAKKQEEIARLERERLAKEAEVRAEAAKKQKAIDDEQAAITAAANKATTEKQKAKAAEAQLLLDQHKGRVEAAGQEAIAQINDAHQMRILTLPTVEAARAKGQVVSTDWEIEVFDVAALARAHWLCVTVTPRLSEIKNLLNQGLQVAGVRARKVQKSSTRSGKQPAAIVV